EIKRQISVGHGNNGVECVGITATHQVSQFLIDYFNGFAAIVLGRQLFEFFGDQIADSAELFVTESVGAVTFKDHFPAIEHRTFRDEDDGVTTGILTAIGQEQLGQLIDVEFVFGNDTTVRRSCHGGKHSSEPCVAAKNLEHQETLVRSRGGAKIVGHLDGSRDAGAEADTVVGSRDVVVHGLRNGDDFHAFLVQAHGVAQGVVAADGDEVLDAEVFQIFEHFGSQIILVSAESFTQMGWHAGFADPSRVGARTVEESTTGAAGAIHRLFGEHLKVFTIVGSLVADHVDQAAPSATKPYDLITFPQGTNGDGANGRIQSGNVASAGEYADDAFLACARCHEFCLLSPL